MYARVGHAADTEQAERQLALPSISGQRQRAQGSQISRPLAEGYLDAMVREADGKEMIGRGSLRPAIDTDISDDSWTAEDSGSAKKKGKTVSEKITSWVDDYKTRKSNYGPPYFKEYGGDLPADCNRMGAHLGEIDELLRNGANPNVGHAHDQGLTPMHFAARFGNVELLKMLKRAGGDPGVTNALGLTPLSYCCAFKLSLSRKSEDSWERLQMDAIKWLLDQGANPNHVDKAGYTPLAWACRSGLFTAVVELIEAGADVMHRRPMLPGGSQVQLPKADPLALTTAKNIERYVQAKINIILQREEAALRREAQAANRLFRIKEMQESIARRKEARQFAIQEKRKEKQTEKLHLELMKADKAEEARKARRDWLRLLKVSPGIWVKVEVEAKASPKEHSFAPDVEGGQRSPVSLASMGSRNRKPRPSWVFDTSSAVSKEEAAAHDVLEEARQVEAFILNGGQKHKIIAPRWRAMTGKRLLRLEHGQRIGATAEKKGRRREEGVGGQSDGGGKGGGPSLSGLEEEDSESSSSGSSSDGEG